MALNHASRYSCAGPQIKSTDDLLVDIHDFIDHVKVMVTHLRPTQPKAFISLLRKLHFLLGEERQILLGSPPDVLASRVRMLNALCCGAIYITAHPDNADEITDFADAYHKFASPVLNEKALEFSAASAKVALSIRAATDKSSHPTSSKKKRPNSSVSPSIPKSDAIITDAKAPDPPIINDTTTDAKVPDPPSINDTTPEPSVMLMELSDDSSSRNSPALHETSAPTAGCTSAHDSPDLLMDTTASVTEVKSIPDDVPPEVPPPHHRPDPLFVKVDEGWPAFMKEINALLSSPVTARMFGDSAKIIPKTADDYRVIQRFLVDRKMEFSCFTPKAERPRKVAISGLSHLMDRSEIKDALSLLGFTILSVTNIRGRASRKPTNIFLVNVAPTPNWDAIYKVTELLHLRVHLRPFAPRGNRQCHRCQRFSHSSFSCSFAARCVKCAGAHLTSSCTKTRDTPALCCLCNGAHTANYAGCPAAPKLKASKSNTKPTAPGKRPAPKAPAPAAAAKSSHSTDTGPAPSAASVPANNFIPRSVSHPQKRNRKKKARPTPTSDSTETPPPAPPAEVMDVTAPTPSGTGVTDLPPATLDLMKDFCSSVNLVRDWLKEGSICEVASSLRELKTEMGALSLSRIAAVWRDLETCFCLPTEPAVQMSNLLSTLSRHLGTPSQM